MFFAHNAAVFGHENPSPLANFRDPIRIFSVDWKMVCVNFCATTACIAQRSRYFAPGDALIGKEDKFGWGEGVYYAAILVCAC